jgi:hypothetical protein
MLDPKKRKPARPSALPGPAEIQGLLLNLAPLAGLEWPPLQARMEALTLAIRGEGGIRREEIEQVRRWAVRFGSLPSQVQEFYRLEPDSDWKTRALWKVLEDQQPVTGWLRGKLQAAWIDRYGCPPNMSISGGK